MMKRKSLIAILFVLYFFSFLNAQNRDFTLTGKVLDNNKDPLPGVAVHVKNNQKNYAVTNMEGAYQIKIPSGTGTVIVFSCLGMKTKEVVLGDQKNLDVVLESDVIALDEVVSIGYGTAKRSDLAGVVSSISAREIQNVPVATGTEALRGRIPGVVITSASGSQEAEVFVRVRGGISVTQDNSPLYIVDGFPVRNGLNDLNPRDIERIDVLKDAASTAIYGSQGANGVIVITTKGGSKQGKTNVSYDTYYSFKGLGKKVDMLSPLEFVVYDYERQGSMSNIANWELEYGKFADIQTNYANRKGIDWQEQMYGGTALAQLHKITLNGGNSDISYNMSYAFNHDDNIVPNSGLKSHDFRLRLDNKISNKLNVSASLTYNKKDLDGVGPYSENGANVFGLLRHRPTIGIIGKDEDLLIFDNPTIDESDNDNLILNPFTQLRSIDRSNKTNVLSGNIKVSYVLNKKIRYNAQLGYSQKNEEKRTFFTEESTQAKLSTGPYGEINQFSSDRLMANHTLSYSQSWGEFKFDILGGQEISKDFYKNLGVGAHGFPNENFGLDYFGLATIADLPSSNKGSSTAVSFFSRANLQIQGKYIFSGTLRADGSSKFGANNKWGYFPAGAFAWRVSEERFIKDNIRAISNLKLRLSYGLSGNNRISDYLSLTIYNPSWQPVDNSSKPSYNPTLANKNLKWETNSTLNIGFDLGLFDNRLSLVADAYLVRTSDLLLNSKIPLTNGFEYCMRNIGETENKGLELSLISYNVEKENFNWVTNFNIAFNKNKVLKLADSNRWEIRSNSGGMPMTDYLVEVGKSTGIMYGFVSDGLYQADEFSFSNGVWKLNEESVQSGVFEKVQPGFKKYKNLNPDQDNITNVNDMTIIGDANPLFTGGVMNTFNYKNIDLSFFVEYSVGGDIYNANIYSYLKTGRKGNTTRWVYDNRYMTIDDKGNFLLENGDVNTLMEINNGRTFPSQSGGYIPFDSSMVEDGSYMRLSNITIGYSFSKKMTQKIGLQSLRLYGTAYNLFVLTNYSGYDPEVSMNRNNGLTPGIDKGSMPRSRNFIVGANVTF